MQKENQENSFMCEQCYRKFDTWRGLRVHQGKVCLKKRRQCRSSDCKTRSKSSQDENHSGAISASVDSPFTLSQQEMEQQTEPGLRKPRILWPAANEKAKYKTLEEEVQKKLKEVKKSSNRGDAKEILSAFATIIYDSAIKEFGICEGKKKTEKKSGLSRRQRVLAQLRKQKRDLQKQKKYAPPEEIEGLRILFEDLKKKSRDLQRHERRCTRRKERKREREQFLKNPYEAAKKLFTEARSGKLECTKEELDAYVKQTYSDSRREEPLPYMRGLKRPAAPVVKYYLGPIREKEVDEFVKKQEQKVHLEEMACLIRCSSIATR
ncbi:protein PRRC2C-like [Aplysia californica]|uniref:Protein PRRC2C-like n=1 Tax=Aplysia californica TaxID=6500 RepID=A0ABM1ACE6_APLCA|nr:protein PRRC2C-like [Aplysia californica]